jgi:hypothetical protein
MSDELDGGNSGSEASARGEQPPQPAQPLEPWQVEVRALWQRLAELHDDFMAISQDIMFLVEFANVAQRRFTIMRLRPPRSGSGARRRL